MDKKVIENKKDFLSLEFLRTFCCDFGMPRNISAFENWWDMTWDEFTEELTNQDINPDQQTIKHWESYFTTHKQKYKALK